VTEIVAAVAVAVVSEKVGKESQRVAGSRSGGEKRWCRTKNVEGRRL
jgi:hypothetical protein